MAEDQANQEPPDYAAATASEHSPLSPPSYALRDPSPKSFTIHGSLIYTPSGPYYQLSSAPTESTYNQILLRRLRDAEARKAQRDELLSYDKSGTIYSLNHPPFADFLVIVPKRRHCLSGSVTLKRGLRSGTWKAQRETRNGKSLGGILFESKSSRSFIQLTGSTPAEEEVNWRNGRGEVVATQKVPRPQLGGDVSGTLELERPLEVAEQDALVACWVGRVWPRLAGPRNLGARRAGRVVLGDT